mgnify:CR=1 FL=1|tara:strand:+ start:924 stop:1109 length:186 start_codon:yes stop_codon:yes gene_type:complete
MGGDSFTVGDYRIEWRNQDQIQICNGRNGQVVILDGGDFESILSGLVAAGWQTHRTLIGAN